MDFLISLFLSTLRLISVISKTLNIGAGYTMPGEIALRFFPDILSTLEKKITKGVIIIAGTNGKTTTSSMVTKVLSDKGFSVLHNNSGANLLNGVVSSFITDPRGSFDFGVFEVDENTLPKVLQSFGKNPGIHLTIVALNLFRDQLDRYGEVDAIAQSWKDILSHIPTSSTVIVNADDPQLAVIGETLDCRMRYFGLGNPSLYLPAMQHATDSIYCPTCGTKLAFAGVYFSHLGDWQCPSCQLKHPKNVITDKDIQSPLDGIYNHYNTMAAMLTALELGMPKREIEESIRHFKPAFGRMEEVMYKNTQFKILLSKNPTGFNESLRTVLASAKKGPILLLLNDRIPDGRDVSWIWDVDFSQLEDYPFPIVISGDRVFDLALCLKYSNDSFFLQQKNGMITPLEGLDTAIHTVVHKTKTGQTVWVLATYSAMLDARKILTGNKIL